MVARRQRGSGCLVVVLVGAERGSPAIFCTDLAATEVALLKALLARHALVQMVKDLKEGESKAAGPRQRQP
jgi:hypothetical protein